MFESSLRNLSFLLLVFLILYVGDAGIVGSGGTP